MAAARGRKGDSKAFKARGARDALCDVDTMAAIAARHGVHPNQVRDWHRLAEDQIKTAFDTAPKGKRQGAPESEATIKDLYAKIGELTMERDFFCRAFGS